MLRDLSTTGEWRSGCPPGASDLRITQGCSGTQPERYAQLLAGFGSEAAPADVEQGRGKGKEGLAEVC